MVDRTDLLPGDDGELPSLDQWLAAKAVLLGERAADGLISDWAAAREGGVTLGALKAWVARSKEGRETDAPYIAEIAAVWASREHDQQDRLEDRLAAVAFSGKEDIVYEGAVDVVGKPILRDDGSQVETIKTRKVSGNTNLEALTRLLRARGRKYADKPAGIEVTVKMSDEDLLARVTAFRRFREIERGNPAIEGEAKVVAVDEMADFDA